MPEPPSEWKVEAIIERRSVTFREDELYDLMREVRDSVGLAGAEQLGISFRVTADSEEAAHRRAAELLNRAVGVLEQRHGSPIPVSITVLELARRSGVMDEEEWHWLGTAERGDALQRANVQRADEFGNPHDYEVQDWDSLPVQVQARLRALGKWR
jgi:hypothetical protein